jgi:amino acid adenylation domain-containing protein
VGYDPGDAGIIRMNEYNVLSLLESSAEKYPDRVAFKDKDEAIDYSNLLTRCQKIAFVIRKNAQMESFEKNRPVVVFIDRNIRSLQLFLAVVYSGNFYVPIDPTLPADRIQSMLDTLQPLCCLSATTRKLPVEATDFDSLLEQSEEMEQSDLESIKRVRELAIDTDPLYAIFTSGTTGVPKSVLVSHRSVIDLVHRFAETFPFPEQPVMANQAPFDFDVSVKDIYSGLLKGAKVALIPREYFSNPTVLMDYLFDNKVTTLIWAVSAMCFVSIMNGLEYKTPDSINKIMFSGELMPVKQLNKWKKYLPDAMYVNLYGPTEITCNCTYHILDREYEKDEVIPIGIPFGNEKVFLLDDNDNRITEPDTEGEICVGGSCLALGYYKDSVKTNKVFVQNPLNNRFIEQIYRTGDLGKYDKNGLLYYTSRKDFQIKHMGQRIELSDIDVSAMSIDGVSRACTIYDHKHKKIVLFFTGESDKETVSAKLKDKLPPFMLPTKTVRIDEFPLNKNGKIDRGALEKL